jgi:uncharacterized protein with HEPN domain
MRTDRHRLLYFGIEWDQVWQVAKNEIGDLKRQVESIIAALPPGD